MVPVNVPNVLTLLRILLVPVLVVALLEGSPDGDLFAAIVFVLASATDFVDGRLARSRGSITTFGKLMDPVADKLLVIAALLALVAQERLAAWVAMVIIARELVVTVLRAGASQQGVVVPAGQLGKVKTTVQGLTILLLIAVGGGHVWLDALVYVMVAITTISGVDAVFGIRRQIAAAERRAASDDQASA